MEHCTVRAYFKSKRELIQLSFLFEKAKFESRFIDFSDTNYTFKDFTYDGFTYNIDKWYIKYIILFTIKSEVICELSQLLVVSL